MRILIHDRLRPYSHRPGTACLLPFTQLQFRIYPAFIQISKLQDSDPQLIQEIGLNVAGPVDQFTIQLDMERGWIRVWGKAVNGFFCYRIQKKEQDWAIAIENDDTGGIFNSKSIEVIDNVQKPEQGKFFEHLSFGCHKAQDANEIKRRCQMREIFPFWFRMSQLILQTSPAHGGAADLLTDCRTAIEQKEAQAAAMLDRKFKNVFLAGFEGIFSPRLKDAEHHGFSLSEPRGSSLWLIQEGARLIRSLFFQEFGNVCGILPLVPPQYHCGKLAGIKSDLASFDIEWTKKQLRRMVIYGTKNGEMCLRLPHEIRHFRLRPFENFPEKVVDSRGTSLQIREGETYFLDRFEK